MRLELSLSPSDLEVTKESISSMNIIEGFNSLASSKRVLTCFYDSPIHFETRSEEEIEKNLLSASVATALARKDLPVPGGP